MPHLWVRNAVAEGIGTFALTFVAVFAVTAGEVTAYALAQGLVILVMVAALGHVSGGHFNPAVTLALLLGRRIDAMGAVIYWAAQVIGGILAAVVALLAFNRDVVAAGTPMPLTDGDLNVVGALVLEALAVFIVVLAVYGTIVDHRAPISAYPFAIGLAYAAGILAIAGLTGGALNPARAFGPAVVGGEWAGTLAWLIGPLVGAVLAWAVYQYVIGLPEDDVEDVVAEPMPAMPVAAAVAAPGEAALEGTEPDGAEPDGAEPDVGAAAEAHVQQDADAAVDADAEATEDADVEGDGADRGTGAPKPPPPPPVDQDLPPGHRGLLE